MTLKHTHTHEHPVQYHVRRHAVRVCVPEVMCPAAHESRTLHGQLNVLQSEAERVGEGDVHRHLLLHLSNAAQLRTEKKNNTTFLDYIVFLL